MTILVKRIPHEPVLKTGDIVQPHQDRLISTRNGVVVRDVVVLRDR